MANEFKLGAILSVNKQEKPEYLRGHLEICRLDHWIKNVFILPGLLIASSSYPQSINLGVFVSILIGFLAAGLVASSNYVINEI